MKSPSSKSLVALAIVLVLGCAVVGVILKDGGQDDDSSRTHAAATEGESVESSPETEPAEGAESPAAQPQPSPTRPPDPRGDFRFERLADGRSLVTESVATARRMHAADAEPITDLEAVDSIFSLYRWAYKEVPEGGDNRELTAALTGANDRKLVFIPADHPSLSATGELLDRWGTPYFFHKISDQVIDVTSAGPDKRLWSGDDLTLGYTETYQSASSR